MLFPPHKKTHTKTFPGFGHCRKATSDYEGVVAKPEQMLPEEDSGCPFYSNMRLNIILPKLKPSQCSSFAGIFRVDLLAAEESAASSLTIFTVPTSVLRSSLPCHHVKAGSRGTQETILA